MELVNNNSTKFPKGSVQCTVGLKDFHMFHFQFTRFDDIKKRGNVKIDSWTNIHPPSNHHGSIRIWMDDTGLSYDFITCAIYILQM